MELSRGGSVSVQGFPLVSLSLLPGIRRSRLRGFGGRRPKKDEQLPLPHPPRPGRLHADLAVPAEEPAASAQEEAHGLPQRAHLAQRR